MKTSRFTESQIVAVLKEAEAGTPVPELCRTHGIGSATFYLVGAKFGGMDASLMKSLFTTIAQVQAARTAWLWTYRNERPNMALRGITPFVQLARAA